MSAFRLLFVLLAATEGEQSVLHIAPRGGPATVPVVRAPRAARLPDLSSESTTYLIDLRDQLDYRRTAVVLSRASLSRDAQRNWVARALREIARRSQRRVRGLLDELKSKGELDSWAGVSIVNRLVVKAWPSGIRALAAHAEVASLTAQVEAEGALEDETTGAGGDPAWPLEAIGAETAWSAGIDGRGVVVGLIDSGVSDLHEQLRANFRGGLRSWFDPLHQSASPSDVQLGHGSAVLSCAVGRRGEAPGGVAPGARWIAAVGLDQGRYNNLLVTRAADWMLNVGRPDVLIVPWHVLGEQCDESLRGIVNAWRAAEMVVVFAAGNGGPGASSDVSPANYANLFPGSSAALSVGSVDSSRVASAHSSRGPSRCGAGLFPQIVAPGEQVLVALPAGPSMYRRASGTSFAAGYVAGAAALLLQKFPASRAGAVEEALQKGATDLGPPGADSTYGHGLLNIPAALEYLETHP